MQNTTLHLVENHLLASTVERHFLQTDTRFAHISEGILAHSSLQKSKSFRFRLFGNLKVEVPPQIFYRIYSMSLMCFYFAFIGMFWSIVMLEASGPIFSVVPDRSSFLSKILWSCPLIQCGEAVLYLQLCFHQLASLWRWVIFIISPNIVGQVDVKELRRNLYKYVTNSVLVHSGPSLL